MHFCVWQASHCMVFCCSNQNRPTMTEGFRDWDHPSWGNNARSWRGMIADERWLAIAIFSSVTFLLTRGRKPSKTILSSRAHLHFYATKRSEFRSNFKYTCNSGAQMIINAFSWAFFLSFLNWSIIFTIFSVMRQGASINPYTYSLSLATSVGKEHLSSHVQTLITEQNIALTC